MAAQCDPACASRAQHGGGFDILHPDGGAHSALHTTKSSNRIVARRTAPNLGVRHVADRRENSFKLSRFDGG